MKILYVLDPATIGGATKSFLGLLGEIMKRNVIPIVCLPEESKFKDILKEMGISVIITGHREMITYKYKGFHKAPLLNLRKRLSYLYHDYKALSIVCNHLKNEHVDLIHTNSSRSDIGFFLSRKLQVPHIVHLREFGDLDYDCYPLNPFYISIYNKYTTKFLSVSDAVKKHWVNKGICEEKVCTIYNGIDVSNLTISDEESKKAPQLHLLMSGGILFNKGHHLAIEAIGMLPDDIKKNIFLTFIGWYDTYYKNYLDRVEAQSKLPNRIKYLGANENVLRELGKYQIGLMCSRAEGFGRVTAEFMHAQLGVIASDSGANPELIEDRKTGILFRNGDVKSLSDAIYRFYMDRELLIKCSNEALRRARHLFTAKKNADEIYSIYREYARTCLTS